MAKWLESTDHEASEDVMVAEHECCMYTHFLVMLPTIVTELLAEAKLHLL